LRFASCPPHAYVYLLLPQNLDWLFRGVGRRHPHCRGIGRPNGWFRAAPDLLAFAVTFDLTIGIPLAYYLIISGS
jgi:hypothetical protein